MLLSRFCRIRCILFPWMPGCWSLAGLPPPPPHSIKLASTHIYTWARRETLESKMCRRRTQLSETAQDSTLLRPLVPVSSALIQTPRNDSYRINCYNRPLRRQPLEIAMSSTLFSIYFSMVAFFTIIIGVNTVNHNRSIQRILLCLYCNK